MTKCGCNWLRTCVPCGNRLGTVDGEISTYRIVNAMKRANSRIERGVGDAEETLAAWCTFRATVVAAVVVAFFGWLATK